ncbi:MAG TPA: cold shock domain-containing protein [Bacteroidia bacterium]|jgi:CspA family cold shock protein|nr:cold shock domain-containing protein [Bacteroidia bacterium]
MNTELRTGIVKFFNNDKGFGFITDKENGEEVFVHATGLKQKIRQNDRVTFETQEGKKGTIAVEVTLA